MRRIRWPSSSRATLAVTIIASAACGPTSERGSRESAVGAYIDAVNRNAVSEALAFHTPDAEFVIPGQNAIQGIDAMRSLLQWDSVLGSHIGFTALEWRGDTLVMGPGFERNAWFQGIGLDSILYSAGTRFVFEGERIRGVYPSSVRPESMANLQAKFEAFWHWAETDAPHAAELAPRGLFKYNAAAAEDWLGILARYQEELRN